MKKIPYIRDSRNFYGKYEVVVNKDKVIPCYNYATALSIKKRIINEIEKIRKKT
jgi:hypothetical protein